MRGVCSLHCLPKDTALLQGGHCPRAWHLQQVALPGVFAQSQTAGIQIPVPSLSHPCAIPVPSLRHPCCGLAGWASMAVQEWVWIAECCARTWCRNILLIPLHSQVVPREFQVGYQEKFPLKHWHRAVWSHHPGSVQKPVKVALHTMAQWNLVKDWTQSWRSFPAFMILWFSVS